MLAGGLFARFVSRVLVARPKVICQVSIGTGGGLLRSLSYPFYCSVCVSVRIRVCVCVRNLCVTGLCILGARISWIRICGDRSSNTTILLGFQSTPHNDNLYTPATVSFGLGCIYAQGCKLQKNSEALGLERTVFIRKPVLHHQACASVSFI